MPGLFSDHAGVYPFAGYINGSVLMLWNTPEVEFSVYGGGSCGMFTGLFGLGLFCGECEWESEEVVLLKLSDPPECGSEGCPPVTSDEAEPLYFANLDPEGPDAPEWAQGQLKFDVVIEAESRSEEACAFAEDVEREPAALLRAIFGEALEGALDLCARQRIGELQRRHIFEDGLHETGPTHQAQTMAGEGAAVVRQTDFEGLDAEDAATRGDRPGDLDLAADEGIEKGTRRAECLGPEGEVAEEFLQRRLAGQAHRADAAFAIEDGEALEEVVDLVEAHGEVDARTRRDGA
jgi:hypothetical protein